MILLPHGEGVPVTINVTPHADIVAGDEVEHWDEPALPAVALIVGFVLRLVFSFSVLHFLVHFSLPLPLHLFLLVTILAAIGRGRGGGGGGSGIGSICWSWFIYYASKRC